MTPTESLESAHSPLIGFYSGCAPDSLGRRIEEIWAWEHDRLEYVHDYIQWLFPLRERSRFNPEAPTLTDADIDAFRRSEELRARIERSLKVMLRFYGLEMTVGQSGAPVVRESEDFPTRRRNWLTPNNHNHLRLTRIMSSVSVLGLRHEARALQGRLLNIFGEDPKAVSRETVRFWQGAVTP